MITFALTVYAVLITGVAGAGWGYTFTMNRRVARATSEAWWAEFARQHTQAALDTELRKRREAELALERELALRRVDTAGWRSP